MVVTSNSVTKLLNIAAGGDPAAANELLMVIYEELHRLARARMARLGPGEILQATELVSETYLRLFGKSHPEWNSRGHFFTAAAQVMRDILVEQARRRGSRKRGGGWKRQELYERELTVGPPAQDVLALDELMAQLERSDPRKARLVLLRCFSGLSLEECAAAMDLSLSTIEREWRFTRAFLKSKLEDRAVGGC